MRSNRPFSGQWMDTMGDMMIIQWNALVLARYETTYGAFHKWGYSTPKWMVFEGKCRLEMDWFVGTPIFANTRICPYMLWSTTCVAFFRPIFSHQLTLQDEDEEGKGSILAALDVESSSWCTLRRSVNTMTPKGSIPSGKRLRNYGKSPL